MAKCERCGNEIGDKDTYCGYCGFEIKQKMVVERLRELKDKLLKEKEQMNQQGGASQPSAAQSAQSSAPMQIQYVPVQMPLVQANEPVSDDYSPKTISPAAKAAGSFERGTYTEVVQKKKMKKGFLFLILFSLGALAAMLLNYTLSETVQYKGIDPILNFFKKDNGYAAAYALVQLDGKKAVVWFFNYFEYIMLGIAGLIALDVILLLLFCKAYRALKFFCNFTNTFAFLGLIAVAVFTGLAFGFEGYMEAIGLAITLVCIIINFFICNIGYRKRKAKTKGNTVILNDGTGLVINRVK